MSAASIYPRLFTKLFASPLMLHPPVRATFERGLLAHIEGNGPLASESERSNERQWREERVIRRVGNVAIVAINGVIDKRVSAFDLSCYGGCDLADVDDALADVARDPAIAKVLLYVNSPGGSVTGTPETAARVAALAEHKYVEAFVDVMACSAGYYIASQASRVVAAPSAVLGSIGVYMAVIDASRKLEMQGIRVQMISAGKHKGMGAHWKPLTEEETAMLQTQVDAIYSGFKAAVKSARPQVSDSTMQGQWFDGIAADDLYLVDALTADTLDERVAALML